MGGLFTVHELNFSGTKVGNVFETAKYFGVFFEKENPENFSGLSKL